MKIKHWQGYGCVNAKKVDEFVTGYNTRVVMIKVEGNHEYGLHRDDIYDVFNWLMKKFAKDCKSYSDIETMTIADGYNYNTNTDTAMYTIEYRC